MNKIDVFSRRRFLRSSGMVTGASLLRLGAPTLAAISQAACTARDNAVAFRTLGQEEAADFAAIAARIIPTTDTPGAAEAGVIYFWDEVLGAYQAGMLPPMRALLSEFGDDQRFATLTEAEQDALLQAHEQHPGFECCRLLTIFGFFAMREHAHGEDHIGWKLVGFEGHQGGWAHPFGYYDARYLEEQSGGE